MDRGDYLPAIGPYPIMSIAALRELGMTRAEVARYFRIAPQALKELERRYEKTHRIEENRARAPAV